MQGPCPIQEQVGARGAAVCGPAAAGPAGRRGFHTPCAASQAGAPGHGAQLQPHGGRHLSAGQVAVLHAACLCKAACLGSLPVLPFMQGNDGSQQSHWGLQLPTGQVKASEDDARSVCMPGTAFQ